MRLLFDQNISYRVFNKLPPLFNNCIHVSQVGLKDATDRDIWQYSRENNYSIVTFDADFYDISIINGHPPKIVWIRTGNLNTNQLIDLLIRNSNSIENFINEKELGDESCIEII